MPITHSYHNSIGIPSKPASLKGGAGVISSNSYKPLVKIAFLITYVGQTFPPWFMAFAESCRVSGHMADWLIFHDGTR